jgi:AmiR/NasT family two-component response regulator
MDSAFRVLRTKARTERRNVVDVAREIIGQR